MGSTTAPTPSLEQGLPPPPGSWSQRLLDWWLGTDWFLSYAWRDGQPLVTALHAALLDQGLRVFLDRRQLRAGDSIGGRLATALHRTRGLILIGTVEAAGNAWVRAELQRAQQRGIVIVPIDVDGALTSDATSGAPSLPLGDLLRTPHAATSPLDQMLAAIEGRRQGERAETAQRRALVATVYALSLLVVLVGVLALVAKFQRDRAVRERDISGANELALRSQLLQADEPVTAAQLAVTAADRTAAHGLVTPAALQQLRASLVDGTPRSAGDRRFTVAVALPEHLVAVTDTCRIVASRLEAPGQWRELGQHQQSVNAIAAIDNDRVLSLGVGGDLMLSQAAAGTSQRIAVLPPRGAGTTLLSALAVDAKRRRLAVGNSDGEIELHTIDDAWQLGGAQRVAGHETMVTALAFTSDGELVSASLDDRVLQWTLTTAEPSARLLGNHGGGARALAIGSDGAIASSGADGAIVLHRTGKQAVVVGRHRVAVSCLHFLSPDVLLSGDARGDLGVWQRLDAEDFRAFDREVVRGGGADALALQPLGATTVRLLGDDGAVRDFELATGSLTREPVRFGTGSDLGGALVAADGKQLLLVSTARDCQWVDLDDPTAVQVLLPKVRALAATADLEELVWVATDGTWQQTSQHRGVAAAPRRLGIANGEQPLLAIGDGGRLVAIADHGGLRVARHGAAPSSVALPAAANWLHALQRTNRLLVGCRDGSLVMVDAGARFVVQRHQANIRAGAVDASERWLATGCEAGRLVVWNLDDAATPTAVGKPIDIDGEQFYAVACAAERVRFVAAGHRGSVQVVDVDGAGAVRRQELAADTSTVALAVSADGELVACASFQATPQRVLVFDLRQPVQERVPDVFPAGPDSLLQVAFVPGGRWLLAHDGSGTVRLWRREPEEVVRHARARLPFEVGAGR